MASTQMFTPSLFGVPAPAAVPERTELVLQIRAQTAAETNLECLRTEARHKAELAYAAGPGRKRVRGWEMLPESDPVFRREKKTRSAYVSRFKAKEYEQLLESSLADAEAGNDSRRATLRGTAAENSVLLAQIRALQAQLVVPAPSMTPPPENESMLTGSPLSTVTLSPLSSVPDEPTKAAELAPFSLDSYPLIGLSKLPIFEDWSSDESEESAFPFLQ